MRIAIIGAAASVVFLSGCGPASTNSTASTPPSEIGRYVIVHSSQVERDTILLDTVTGKTWSRVVVTDLQDEPAAWEAMPQLSSDADFAALRAAHPPKPKRGSASSDDLRSILESGAAKNSN